MRTQSTSTRVKDLDLARGAGTRHANLQLCPISSPVPDPTRIAMTNCDFAPPGQAPFSDHAGGPGRIDPASGTTRWCVVERARLEGDQGRAEQRGGADFGDSAWIRRRLPSHERRDARVFEHVDILVHAQVCVPRASRHRSRSYVPGVPDRI